MKEAYIPLISAFIGALIGALASIITIWIQSRAQDRRERLRHAAELALEDYKLQLEIAEKTGTPGAIPPVVIFLHYHIELMKLMEKNNVTPESLRKLDEQNERVIQVTKELNK